MLDGLIPILVVRDYDEIVLEKKRLFHSQRCLELKNLPEGVTEQVSI